MLKSISLVAAVLLTFPALAAPSDPDPGKSPPARERTSGLMRYDTNKDGFVDRSEWGAGQEARFKLLDTNNDGKLSKDELFVGNGAPPSDRQIRSQASNLASGVRAAHWWRASRRRVARVTAVGSFASVVQRQQALCNPHPTAQGLRHAHKSDQSNPFDNSQSMRVEVA